MAFLDIHSPHPSYRIDRKGPRLSGANADTRSAILSHQSPKDVIHVTLADDLQKALIKSPGCKEAFKPGGNMKPPKSQIYRESSAPGATKFRQLRAYPYVRVVHNYVPLDKL